MASLRIAGGLLAVLCLVASTQPATAAATAVNGKATLISVVKRLEALKHYNTFLALLGESGLVPLTESYLSQGIKLTVLIPDDKAFARVPAATLDALRKDKTKLQAVLLYHAIPQFQSFNQLAKTATFFQFNTLANKPLVRWPHIKFSTVAFGPPAAKSASQIGKIFHANLVIQGHIVICHAIDHVLIPL